MNDKIMRDPYFSLLYQEKKNYNYLVKCGYFDDNIETIDYNLSVLTTEIGKLAHLDKDKENVVLVSTGCYNPVHSGHIGALELARTKLEDSGYNVIGGYLSPTHYEYSSTKSNSSLSNSERLTLLEQSIEDSNWISLELWEMLYCSGAVNFTEVVMRLKQYLHKYLSTEIKIAYVCGSDNILFSECFSKTDILTVCISRDNKEMSDDNGNVLFVKENPYSSINSTQIRENLKYNEKHNSIDKYGLRIDDTSLSEELTVKYNKYITNIFHNYFKESLILLKSPDEIKATFDEPTISLDSIYTGDYNLGVSREFNVSSSQVKPNRIVSRDSSQSLEEHIKAIPGGEYILVDDDSISGFTLSEVKKEIEKYNPNVKITSNAILVKVYIYDIVDSRDFLLTEVNSGLVSELGFRVPYIYPYVNLTSRASINKKEQADFSISVLEMNLKMINEDMKLKDLKSDCRQLFEFSGYSDNSKVKDILLNLIKTLRIVSVNLHL